MTNKKFICIICPKGCAISAVLDGNKIVSVSGNSCVRGEKYAISECTAPVRTVTSTVRCTDGSVIPVRTEKAIPKSKIAECMKIINNAVTDLPVAIGDVIIDDVFGTKIIATDSKNAG